MPGLTYRNCQSTNDNAVSTANGFWCKQSDEISFSSLQKFWSELSPQARQDLLKLNKKSILEQARKSMYCSRCNGLLLESFMQIVMSGKSSKADGTSGFLLGRRNGALNSYSGALSNSSNAFRDDIQDPAFHPWGGLTTAKDGTLTVLSTYIYSKSLTGLQNVFDSARAREKERGLLYPDACGGEGRGWISQGISSYGRGHGTREACALHTARLSCDTLVNFWSALGEESRHSLLRMKEEDFIERLMYRFDSKRFCRDCRKNVIREFKELKELKRMKREPRCTHSFCSADSVLQYEVSDDMIRADWRQTFMDSAGTFHHFEWAVGTGEGKSDILDFKNIGMNKFVNVDGLHLGDLTACYITLRAWKQDGRCTELSVKAHALKKGQECVHNRLVVGDGFVSITKGESIQRFFEHAEEVEEEEDDDAMDKDGNEMDAECSLPQKHAKSPELAREFLLDAATVIFKEQVEKAFREGTALQNAHSVFVCLVLKLLEERVHIACKEIITLEKQMKLLEEEEKEKFEEEERKERRRTKEKEKKQRRKEKLKAKDGDKDKESCFNSVSVPHQDLKDEQSSVEDKENIIANGRESPNGKPTGGMSSPNMQDQVTEISSECYYSSESRNSYQGSVADSAEVTSAQDECDYTTSEHSEYSFHGDKYRKYDTLESVSKCSDGQRSNHASKNGHTFTKSESRIPNNKFEGYSKNAKGLSRQIRLNEEKAQPKSCAMKLGREKFHLSNSRMREKYDSCSCTHIPDYRVNGGSNVRTAISCSEDGGELKRDSSPDKAKKFHYGAKNYQSDYMHDSRARSHSKGIFGNNRSRDQLHTRMVWEPMGSLNKYPRRNSESDIAMVSSSLNVEGSDTTKNQSESISNCCDENAVTLKSETSSAMTSCVCDLNKNRENNDTVGCKMNPACSGGLLDKEVDTSLNDSSDVAVGSDSDSEKSYSNMCGGNSNLTSSSSQNLEMTSSDSEDASQLSENKEISLCQRSEFPGCRNQDMEKTPISKPTDGIKSDLPTCFQFGCGRFTLLANSPEKSTLNNVSVPCSFQISEHQVGLPVPPNQNFPNPIFHLAPSTIGYYHPSTIIWPTTPANGLIAMPRLNPYVASSPLNSGWNGTPGYFMPYGGVSHLEPPLLSQGQVPIYHPVSKGTGINPEERVKIAKPTLAHNVSFQIHNKLQIVPTCIQSEDTQNGRMLLKPDPESKQISKEKSSSFSLFHFGGPVALSSTLKEGKIDEFDLSNSQDAEVDHIYSKKEATIEEYSLFAASNGFKFSL